MSDDAYDNPSFSADVNSAARQYDPNAWSLLSQTEQ